MKPGQKEKMSTIRRSQYNRAALPEGEYRTSPANQRGG